MEEGQWIPQSHNRYPGLNSKPGPVKNEADFLNSSFSYWALMFIHRQAIWFIHVGENCNVNTLYIRMCVRTTTKGFCALVVRKGCLELKQIHTTFTVLRRTAYLCTRHWFKTHWRINTCFSVVTHLLRNCLLLYRDECHGCVELMWYKQNRYGDDQFAEAAEDCDMVKCMKRHASIQTPCGFRTHSQLVLESARDARLVGKHFRWLAGGT
jgi:hypothetical protein